MSLKNGEVSIVLGGEEKVLKPTYSAVVRINKHFGGIAEAAQAVGKVDIRAVTVIVRHALDLTEKEVEKILETVVPGNSKELRESLFAAISESIFSRAEKAIGEEIANGEIWMRIRA